MMPIQRFEDLECWQQARQLVNAVYQLIKTTDAQRDFSLRDQMTSAAISVMYNIVEGFDSGSPAEFMKFLGYSRRSASEVQTCLYVALDQGLVHESVFKNIYDQAERTRKIIDGFRRYLRRNTLTGDQVRGSSKLRKHGHTGIRVHE